MTIWQWLCYIEPIMRDVRERVLTGAILGAGDQVLQGIEEQDGCDGPRV